MFYHPTYFDRSVSRPASSRLWLLPNSVDADLSLDGMKIARPRLLSLGRCEVDPAFALAGEDVLDVVPRVKVDALQIQVLLVVVLDNLVSQLACLQHLLQDN